MFFSRVELTLTVVCLFWLGFERLSQTPSLAWPFFVLSAFRPTEGNPSLPILNCTPKTNLSIKLAHNCFANSYLGDGTYTHTTPLLWKWTKSAFLVFPRLSLDLVISICCVHTAFTPHVLRYRRKYIICLKNILLYTRTHTLAHWLARDVIVEFDMRIFHSQYFLLSSFVRSFVQFFLLFFICWFFFTVF